jgi:uncharacterized membrane protein
VRKILQLFLLTFVFLISCAVPVFAQSDSSTPLEERQEAVVTRVLEEKELHDGNVKRKYQRLELIGTGGNLHGKNFIVENGKDPIINSVEYDEGDKIVLSITKNNKGESTYMVTDYVRRQSLLWLFIIFVFLAVIIAGLRGIFSIIGMGISFLVIFFFVLPQILAGRDPILVAILSSCVIIPITFYLSHGYNKKTTVAIVGTIISLVITGFLANMFVEVAHLSGLASEEAGFLESMKKGAVQLRGLLLAGIIIGALGVLDDVTVSQASVVYQLKMASPRISIRELFIRAMDVGQDHIASMVNTLVLVYTGAALPLLLLFINNSLPYSVVVNYEFIAEEIVRTLVVSIGLILSVPIVTFLASITYDIDIRQAVKDIFKSLR